MLFLMVQWYDQYIYTPVQVVSTPFVEKIPRSITIYGTEYTVFSANIVTYSRTLLIIPIAICLKMNYFMMAFSLVLFHDYLDHLDGIVAKVHKKYGYQDDPKLGSFLDAFCDKIVICTTLWSILLLTQYHDMTNLGTILFLGISCTIMLYEVILGIVRIQDYYASSSNESRYLAANMEGKLKEKLETIGLACLCLSMPAPLESNAGLFGLVSLFLATHLAHKSLLHKLKGRMHSKQSKQTQELKPSHSANSSETVSPSSSPSASISCEKSTDYLSSVEEPYDYVFTIGCFDLFHYGHVNLMNIMKKAGKTLIVGVHSDESIYELKKKHPLDPLAKRMENVKQYADIVYAIPAADPTTYILSAIPLNIKNGVYIRGDDMLNFPSRQAVENLLDVKFVPYTAGVSSTMLRAKLLEQQHLVDQA